jgi:hypothetical protein
VSSPIFDFREFDIFATCASVSQRAILERVTRDPLAGEVREVYCTSTPASIFVLSKPGINHLRRDSPLPDELVETYASSSVVPADKS